MKLEHNKLRVGVVGAGFSGTVFALNLKRLARFPVEIVLFEKSGQFGLGEAYRTPFDFHLLNVRAGDMSAFEDEPTHFVSWLAQQPDIAHYLDPTLPITQQFMPRFLYGRYLQSLFHSVDENAQVSLQCEAEEVIDIVAQEIGATLRLKDNRVFSVDVVVLATGNHPAATLPFPVTQETQVIDAWDYLAPQHIPATDPVLIVGTGLSMVDAVLTLHYQGHQGEICAISRHGLLPLPHVRDETPFFIEINQLPTKFPELVRYVRREIAAFLKKGGDWRSVMNGLRPHFPDVWSRASLREKEQFFRHVLSYWNIHRHRLHYDVAALLAEKVAAGQLTLLAGHVLSVSEGEATLRLRGTHRPVTKEVKWLINCVGPAIAFSQAHALVQQLVRTGVLKADPLQIGLCLAPSGACIESDDQISSRFFVLGSLRKAAAWEVVAVPEIRKQCFLLAKELEVRYAGSTSHRREANPY
ncbi:MAG TPA: FAD/NAD(P)-binding protein [Gammaproteobacteria bacterium]|nr:FAD/NAD(P)-binding protein [Gammaproteobacteria bacterium]